MLISSRKAKEGGKNQYSSIRLQQWKRGKERTKNSNTECAYRSAGWQIPLYLKGGRCSGKSVCSVVRDII